MWNPHIVRAEGAAQKPGYYVLSGVILHPAEAYVKIDLAPDISAHRSICNMHDVIAADKGFFAYAHTADVSRIARLSAASGIERTPIEHDLKSAIRFGAGYRLRVKFRYIAVVVVKAMCHVFFSVLTIFEKPLRAERVRHMPQSFMRCGKRGEKRSDAPFSGT